MRSPIRLTLLRLDTAAARAVGRCHEPAAGTAVIRVRPDTRRPG